MSIQKTRAVTSRGLVELDLDDPDLAAYVTQHQEAVREYLLTGDPTVLLGFNSLIGNAHGALHRLVTDPDELARLAQTGEVDPCALGLLSEGENDDA